MARKAPLLKQLNSWPPFVCHALARINRRGRTQRIMFSTLASRAQMSEQKFYKIATSLTWQFVDAGDIERFCLACDTIIWGDMRKHRLFFNRQMQRKTPFDYLGPRLANFKRLSVRWRAAKSLAAVQP